KLSIGDEIAYEKQEYFKGNFSGISSSFFTETTKVVEVYPGPEFELLSIEQKRVLMDSVFTISNSINRMAIQLEEKLKNSIFSIITSPVLPGTVQLTPSGNLIVLMRDCQTTG
ncbi:allophanate hydrolase subunit 2 family protein, partial [Aquimarina celericrescens]|nr:allophanate hydrolase subunit 2 family protein [Aquimarina celericrescens]